MNDLMSLEDIVEAIAGYGESAITEAAKVIMAQGREIDELNAKLSPPHFVKPTFFWQCHPVMVIYLKHDEYKDIKTGKTTEIIELKSNRFNEQTCPPGRKIRLMNPDQVHLCTSKAYDTPAIDENSLKATITGFNEKHAMANYPAYHQLAVAKFPDMEATHAFINIALGWGEGDE